MVSSVEMHARKVNNKMRIIISTTMKNEERNTTGAKAPFIFSLYDRENF